MSATSKIEWTDATWNPVVGCTRVSAACDHCYAVSMSHRIGSAAESVGVTVDGADLRGRYIGLTSVNGRGDRHFNGVVRCVPEALETPLRWRKPRRIFIASMGDIFHTDVPFSFLDRIFAVMALCPQHTFQVLTKRPARMAEYLTEGRPGGWCTFEKVRMRCDERDVDAFAPSNWPLPNVWLGCTAEDKDAADERIRHLMRCPAEVRFVSCEPLLDRVDLTDLTSRWVCDYCGASYAEYCNGCPRCHFGEPGTSTSVRLSRLHWVIAGGEQAAGGKARETDDDWYRSLRDQCRAAGVPFFLKQRTKHGRKIPFDEWPEDLRVRQTPDPRPIGDADGD